MYLKLFLTIFITAVYGIIVAYCESYNYIQSSNDGYQNQQSFQHYNFEHHELRQNWDHSTEPTHQLHYTPQRSFYTIQYQTNTENRHHTQNSANSFVKYKFVTTRPQTYHYEYFTKNVNPDVNFHGRMVPQNNVGVHFNIENQEITNKNFLPNIDNVKFLPTVNQEKQIVYSSNWQQQSSATQPRPNVILYSYGPNKGTQNYPYVKWIYNTQFQNVHNSDDTYSHVEQPNHYDPIYKQVPVVKYRTEYNPEQYQPKTNHNVYPLPRQNTDVPFAPDSEVHHITQPPVKTLPKHPIDFPKKVEKPVTEINLDNRNGGGSESSTEAVINVTTVVPINLDFEMEVITQTSRKQQESTTPVAPFEDYANVTDKIPKGDVTNTSSSGQPKPANEESNAKKESNETTTPTVDSPKTVATPTNHKPTEETGKKPTNTDEPINKGNETAVSSATQTPAVNRTDVPTTTNSDNCATTRTELCFGGKNETNPPAADLEVSALH